MKVIAFSLFLLAVFSIQFAPAAIADDIAAVASLEKRFLGSERKADPLEKRVARLEKLVFGESAQGSLADRLHRLTSSLPNSNTDEQTPNSTAPSNPEKASEPNQNSSQQGYLKDSQQYPRINALEELILQKRFSSEPLENRLDRLEERAFGKTMPDMALSDRSDALQKFVEKRTGKSLIAEKRYQADNSGAANPVSEQAREKRSRVPQLINMVSTALFGPPNMSYGPAVGPVGFGGIRMRHRQDVENEKLAQSQEPEPKPTKPEDPNIYRQQMPPNSANTRTKVGWCEHKLFGYTFIEKHLPERLLQISKKLDYAPHKSGIQLMDDVDKMVKLTNERRLSSTKNSSM